MEYEKIKQLMDDMGNSNLTAINIDFPDGTKISMKKEMTNSNQVQQTSKENAKPIIEASNELSVQEKGIEEKGNIIKSPMVGTFYTKSSPTASPYVEIGTDVKKGDTLCMIEAMKLMNEIQSEYAGKVTEIFVEDGSAVEYGTCLFRIE